MYAGLRRKRKLNRISASRRYKKYKRGAGRYISRVPARQLFPDTMYVTMKYNEDFQQTSVIVGTGTYEFRGNSIFDPNSTGVGHQPFGHDTYEQMYRRYTVLGCRMVLEFVNRDDDPIAVAIAPKYNSISGSSYEQIAEDENGQTMVLGPSTDSSTGTIYSRYIASRDILGKTEGEVTSTFFGNNPTVPWYWGIIWDNLNGNANYSVAFRVTLHFYVKLEGKTSMSLS